MQGHLAHLHDMGMNQPPVIQDLPLHIFRDLQMRSTCVQSIAVILTQADNTVSCISWETSKHATVDKWQLYITEM